MEPKKGLLISSRLTICSRSASSPGFSANCTIRSSLSRFSTPSLGAFSLDRSRPRSIFETLQYAAELLTTASERQNALWIFPQGKIEQVDKRPLLFFKGTASIVSRVLEKEALIYLVSVVSRIEYLDEQKPELFLSFKAPLLISSSEYSGADELTASMQHITENHLDELSGKIRNRMIDEALVIVRGAASINKRVEAFSRFLRLGKKGKE